MEGWAPDSKGHRLDGEAESLRLDPVVHLQVVGVNTFCKERFSIECVFACCADLLVLVVHLKALPHDAIRGDVLPHLKEK